MATCGQPSTTSFGQVFRWGWRAARSPNCATEIPTLTLFLRAATPSSTTAPLPRRPPRKRVWSRCRARKTAYEILPRLACVTGTAEPIHGANDDESSPAQPFGCIRLYPRRKRCCPDASGGMSPLRSYAIVEWLANFHRFPNYHRDLIRRE